MSNMYNILEDDLKLLEKYKLNRDKFDAKDETYDPLYKDFTSAELKRLSKILKKDLMNV